MAISKADVAKLVASGGRGQLEARMRILQDPAGYISQTPDAPAAGAPAAPVPPVSNPPGTPPAMSAREQWRAEITRLGQSPNGGDQLRARQMVLNGDPPEVPPAPPPEAK